jgi:hypothetical protein
MSQAIYLIPITISAIVWYGVYVLNRRKCLFRTGEVIFWDTIILILVFLVWLKWF